jgi:hypothetical protein
MSVIYALRNLERLDPERLAGFETAFVHGPADAQVLDMTDGFFREMAANDFPQGVAFGPRRELRWLKRRNGTIHVVIVTEEDNEAPDGFPRLRLTHLSSERPARLLLLGRRTTGLRFEDGRIPGYIEYPRQSEASELAVEIRHYEAEDGRRLWRYARLVDALP